jgi:hypothetical protein
MRASFNRLIGAVAFFKMSVENNLYAFGDANEGGNAKYRGFSRRRDLFQRVQSLSGKQHFS